MSSTEVDPECAPFDKPKNDIGKFYAPCGAIANSLFSDKIILSKNYQISKSLILSVILLYLRI